MSKILLMSPRCRIEVKKKVFFQPIRIKDLFHVKPGVHEQFLCNNFYMTIVICSRSIDEENWPIFVW